MATSVVPALIDALVSQCDAALPLVTVYDGFGRGPADAADSGNTGDFLMVGADDPDAQDSAIAATSQESPGPFATTRKRNEVGEVVLVAQSWNGNGDQKAARDAVYAIAGAVANLCRTSPGTNLGIQNDMTTGYGSSSELRQDQNEDAAVARLTFRIAFWARI